MHSPPLHVTTDSTTSPSLLRRLLRALAWTGFGLGLLFVLGLGIASLIFSGAYGPLIGIVAGSAAVLWAMGRIKTGAGRRLGLGYAGLGIVFVYLVVDDSGIRRPQTLEQFSPAFPGAEKSYEVLMRYGKNHPLGKDFRFKTPDHLYRGTGAWKPKDPDWKTWLAANRADLENGWAKLEPVRNWLTDLNTFERIGDLTPTQIDAEILAFAPIRVVSQHACAIASLQAIDGQGDAAIETLLPVIEVGRKLVPSSRTLVRSMIAIVIQKIGMETAEFILSSAEISPASRARLAAALTDEDGPEIKARKLIEVEYAWAASLYMNQNLESILAWGLTENLGDGWLREVLQKGLIPLSPFLYNSNRTINLYSDLATELEDLAARRELKQLDERSQEFFRQSTRAGFKNLGGAWLISSMVPAFSKVIESFWKTEDLRTNLHARLKA